MRTDERQAEQETPTEGPSRSGDGSGTDAGLDVRRETDSPEAALAPDAYVEDPAPLDVPRNGRVPVAAFYQLIALRDRVRVDLHRYLDDMLAQPSQLEKAEAGMTLLDDIVGEVTLGAGFSLNIRTEYPNAPGRAEEDPSVTAAEAKPQSLIEIVP